MKILRMSFALSALVACSNNNPANDGGTGNDSGTEGGGNNVNQTGTIVDFTSKSGLTGATVSSGTATATTDAKGKYTLSVLKDTAYTMTISSDAYLTLNEQEWKLSGDADRGNTSAVSNTTENLLKAILVPQPSKTLGVLSIQVEATGTCAADGGTGSTGATISIAGLSTDGGAGPKLVYFSGNFPSASATSVTDGQVPSAIIYDLPPGTITASQLTITHPSCTVASFPIADQTIPTLTYTGNAKVEASQDDAGVNVASYMRVFLK